MIVELYLAEVEGKGYYARSQPTYEWCFTTDVTKAAIYRSLRTAQYRVASHKHGSGHGNRPWRVVKVDGNLNILEQPPFQPFPVKETTKWQVGETITLATLIKKEV